MSSLPLILPVGTVLGGYTIDEVIGIGGMAVVYRAEQRSLGRHVALKVLNPRLGADATFRARFRREGSMVAALDHPNVVPVFDLGEEQGRLFLAMRLIQGGTLADRMADGGLTAAQTVAVLRPIASALDAAHAAGVLHRDVKPQNVLLSDDGGVFLADFGVAKAAASDLTRTTDFFGSVSYVAPEQIRGHAVGPAADIYAFAVMTHHCFTGEAPFQRDTEAGVFHAHLEESAPTIGDPSEAWAHALTRAVGAGLAKDPDDRPGAVSGFLRAVDDAVQAMPLALQSCRPACPPQRASVVPAEGPPEEAVVDGPGHTVRIDVQAESPATPAPVLASAPGPAASLASAPALASPVPPAAAPIVDEAFGFTVHDRRRPELERRAAEPVRWPLVAAIGVLITIVVVGVLVMSIGALSAAPPPVPRLAASGAPERLTRAARSARTAAIARRDAAAKRTAQQRAAEKRAAARRAAARRAKARADAAASAALPATSSSSGSSGASAPAAVSPASAGGGTAKRAPSASSCDFPPC